MSQREIKFRVWNTEDKRWHPYQSMLAVKVNDGVLVTATSDKNLSPVSEQFIYQQYTGLKDKNGKEIYEGDIVNVDGWSPSAMSIAFIEGAFCLASIRKTEAFNVGEYIADIHYVKHAGQARSEIIGNIYENPELIK